MVVEDTAKKVSHEYRGGELDCDVCALSAGECFHRWGWKCTGILGASPHKDGSYALEERSARFDGQYANTKACWLVRAFYELATC